MSAYNPSIPSAVPHPAAYGSRASVVNPGAPAGTFAPGTKIQVGGHKVIIQKYFSEGGFAHVYLVKMPKPIDGTDIAVLKRVAVPDKDSLANMRTEVETMKKLKGHRPIVTYYDSHASQLKGGGYEVFLLMEFCNGGGLIDFMNTRLQNRLTEPEILKIFSDVAEGVACMHYLKPPLLHRDLKVENVLITSTGSSRRFKLCDFGSTAPPRPAGNTPQECRLIEEDVQKHTTLQYRSPEMIDVYRKQPIDEKSDIWALGVLLYKLCYYTTPFEEQGQLAILNASFKFPAYPPFSDNLKKLIASMLKENPRSRPNIYQVLREACLMQNIKVPIKDIYSGRAESESKNHQQLPSPPSNIASPPLIGAVYSPPIQQQAVVPDVVPMRRGRPAAAPQPHISKPSPSPLRGRTSDPFAALDSNSAPSIAADDVASRFPSLDQFSLLHDHGSRFDFGPASPTASSKPKDLSQRVTERLADDAFATSQSRATPPSLVSRAQQIISQTPALQKTEQVPNTAPAQYYEAAPPRPTMVSTGTMTSPSLPPTESQPVKTSAPIYRFPTASDHHRSASVPRADSRSRLGNMPSLTDSNENDAYISRSYTSKPSIRQPAPRTQDISSSRPSLEGGRPSFDSRDPILRTQSSHSRYRPGSTHVESSLDYLRDREANAPVKPNFLNRQPTSQKPPDSIEGESPEADDSNIESNIDFLRRKEQEDEARKNERRRSASDKKAKRSSMPSMSLTGTKTILAGKFGDAFKRFENATVTPGPRTPSPLDSPRRDLTPIAGSEATDGRSDDGYVVEDSDELPPEQRRELERRRLSDEEHRVATAAAEYRQRLADRDDGQTRTMGGGGGGGGGGVTRAASIQHKVKTLLDDSQRSSPTKRTAEGYGHYTESIAAPTSRPVDVPLASSAPSTSANPYFRPVVARKPQVPSSGVAQGARQSELTYPRVRSSSPAYTESSRTATLATRTASRPSAPPKPIHLNIMSTGPLQSGSPPKSTALPSPLYSRSAPRSPHPDMTAAEKEDYVAEFSKRFPSLSGIEMVETAIEVGGGGASKDISRGRSKEV